jgi:hypothetical protein
MSIFNYRDVEAGVMEVYAMRGDPEAAHSAEDALYLRVLEKIARGEAMDPQKCAEIAIRTQGIDFPRWCA